MPEGLPPLRMLRASATCGGGLEALGQLSLAANCSNVCHTKTSFYVLYGHVRDGTEIANPNWPVNPEVQWRFGVK